ncbi:Late embryogenesis abundant protein [Actinidia chinensis var. chinensis]|uniref:Late embryogenesis abundant protein n=1 Tax=Actinidia chinensis var. chinensis TaxID=1590841 RepID=A0A2R6QN67_ACTCC|nr:Late embryogenesis abundant protein [Actinidia chinensis var. chinensis]
MYMQPNTPHPQSPAMSAKELQLKPLAPAAHRISIDEADRALSMELRRHRRKSYVKCCGCAAALVLIQAVVVLILIFTVFQVKDPVLRLNSFKMDSLDLSNPNSSRKLTVTADVSVKNRNVASFKFTNATLTTIYYGGVAVGEGRTPPGVAKARRTLRLNVTIDVMVGRLLGVPRFTSDLRMGLLNMSSYTSVRGRVKIMKLIKKNVMVRMNCSMTVNATSNTIQDQKCRPTVSI